MKLSEMILRLAFAFVLLNVPSFGVGSASAATKELARLVFSAIPWDENTPGLDERRQFALAIEAYWVEFDRRVPRLSPKEREWLEGELATQGERLNRAFYSKEYAIWSLNRHTDSCLTTIRGVIGSQASESARQFEMFHWLKMVNCYDGSGDLRIYLDRLDISYNDDAGRNIQTPLSNVAQEIIVNKVAPMAMAETMGWSFEN